MKPRRAVDMLPTISEMQEGDPEVGDPDLPTHSMEEYLDSIKELSQTASYPLHGPLRGHRRWPLRHATIPVVLLSTYHSSMAYAPWAPVSLCHVSLAVARRPHLTGSARDPLDWLFAQSQLAGLA